MLEKGIYTEETVGNLDGAIEIYQKIITDDKADRPYVAQAHYRLGMCYLKKGDQAKAHEAFRKILTTFPDQEAIVAEARKKLAAQEAQAKSIAVTMHDGTPTLSLEKVWFVRAGLLVLRLKFYAHLPSGMAPEFDRPEDNPWGLGRDDIPSVVAGQVLLDEWPQVRRVAMGGMRKRWAGYVIYKFTPDQHGALPKTLRFRQLLVRKRQRGENRKEWAQAVLKNPGPSDWRLCVFGVPVTPYVCERIPEEIYDSPNLPVERGLLPALRGILKAYEDAGQADQAIDFINKQGPNTRELLQEDVRRLLGKAKP